MGKLKINSTPTNRVPLLNGEESSSNAVTDLEHGDAVQPANVGFGRVLRLAKPEAGRLVIASIALLIASTSNILVPKYGGKIIDIVSKDFKGPEQRVEALNAIKNTVIWIVTVVFVGSFSAAIRAWLFSSSSERVVAKLRKNLFSHLINQHSLMLLELENFLSRLSEDTQIIKNAATTNLSEALRNLSTAFIGLGFMFTTSWRLTLLSLAVVPAISVAVRKFGRFLRELSHKTQAAAAVAASIAEETFGAIRTVRSFAQEDFEISRYSVKVDETLNLGLRQAKVVGLFAGGMNAASTLSVIVVVVYVGSSVSALSGLYTTAMKAAGASRRVFQLLDRASSMPKSGDKCPTQLDFHVQFAAIWVLLNSPFLCLISCASNLLLLFELFPCDLSVVGLILCIKVALKGISLKLSPGSKFALVGPSGGGKTTVANLIERFYDPVKGMMPSLDERPYEVEEIIRAKFPVVGVSHRSR
ncbi:hypothetical protein HPP92_018771 [Vanilla planifolia]|uniref:ABC transmembrane type-1 domain-containing protein n=1 Tax=Vanilla planifolia TaxID=51239 RepID=A0A835QB71_VANPL|nr:hypothetical protein HPP92_018771 [Vanilla planifolia]